MELKVEHLAPYLPYGLRMRNETHKALIESKGQTYHDSYLNSISREGHLFIGKRESSVHISTPHWKPVLRPLSMLDKEIEHKGEKFIPIEWLEDKYYTLSLHKECERLIELDGHKWTNHLSYLLLIHLFEWHFDVFGLIPNGLAYEQS